MPGRDGRLRRRTVLAVFGAAAATCAGRGPAEAATSGPLRVGVLVDLSGPARLHGARQLLGIQVAAELINRDTRREGVELIVADTRGDAEHATRVAAELIAVSGVPAIVGPSTSASYAALLELTGREGIPLVAPLNGDTPTEPQAFRTGVTMRQIVRVLAADMIRDGLRSVAVLATYSPASNGLLRELDAQLPPLGLRISAVERYRQPVENLTTQLRAAAATAPDAMFIWSLPPYDAVGARDARGIGWTGPLYFGTGSGTPMFLDHAGDAAEGARVIGGWLLVPEHAPRARRNHWAMLAFIDAFEATHGPVGVYTGYGADALGLVHAAAGTGHDPACIRTALESTHYLGASGTYRMSRHNHAGVDDGCLVVVTVHNGKWTVAR